MSLALPIRNQTRSSASVSREGTSDSDPHGFIAILMDGAIERIRTAHELIAGGDSTGRLLRTTRLILGELRAGLDLREGGAIAANLDDLYDYMIRRLRAADHTDGLAALNEVSHLLDALRAAWAFMPAEVRAEPRN